MRRLAAVLIAASAMLAPGAASARPLPAVIGCIDIDYYDSGRANWLIAPRGCTTGGSLGSTEGISGVRWIGWGRGWAAGRGDLVDGLGFAYPARIIAFRKRTVRYCSCVAYIRLHVVAPAQWRAAWRGPFNVFIDVTPQ